MGILSALFGGSNSVEINETHVVEYDTLLEVFSLGLLHGTAGHRVTKWDSDGCEATGRGDTYEAASFNASQGLERTHRDR
jgi:hypothetical protein